MNAAKLKRVLLKISGESLMGVDSYGIDVSTVDRVAKEISQVSKLGIEICLVIGAGTYLEDYPELQLEWIELALTIWVC